MAFNAEAFLAQFEAGEAVPVLDLDFKPMEDTLVRTYLPPYDSFKPEKVAMCEHNWQNRDRLIDLIRGNHFFGQLINPIVEKQPDALTTFIETSHTGYRGPKAILPGNIVGLQLTAGVRSTRRDIAGSISRYVWYIRKSESGAHRDYRLWARVTGPDMAENTIEEAFKASRAAGHLIDRSAPQRTGRVVGKYRNRGR